MLSSCFCLQVFVDAVVKSIHIYPVKSCRGYELSEATITERGIMHDRSFVLVSKGGLAITQREFPRLALVVAEMTDEITLKLTAPEMGELSVEKKVLNEPGTEVSVRVWDDTCEAVDQGDYVADWFSNFLASQCRLVTMPDRFVRPVNKKYATGDQQVGFADGFPFLLLSEASLADLNSKLEYPVPMNRFRPNIVVEGCEAFAEDNWKSFRIGDLVFDVVKPCARCVIITIDQDDAILGKEPMRTLAGYRQKGSKVIFGQNLVHHANGKIRIGDRIELL